MIKNTILQHKLEKEKLAFKDYVLREKLFNKQEYIENDLIKIITGPRRAGKSVTAFLMLKDKEFAYLNFDDENLLKIDNYDQILQALFEVYPNSKYIFFDEIQNLDNWEFFVSKLHRRGYNLILTGSNAKLLSRELATSLTGRYIPIEILPFSFSEFIKTQDFGNNIKELDIPENHGNLLNLLEKYLLAGGFPEVIIKKLEPSIYLETLSDSILFKDVVKRYRVKYSQKIYELNNYLRSNFASECSFLKLKKILDFRSTTTLQNYLSYIEEAYLVFILNRFSFKMKEQINAPKKIYLVDNGFCSQIPARFSQDFGKLIENAVFIEILRKGFRANLDLFYYKTRNGKEIDFIIKSGINVVQLIQVCYRIDKLETREREIKALIEGGEELSCSDLIIITWDHEELYKFKGKEIKFMPLWKWLLQ